MRVLLQNLKDMVEAERAAKLGKKGKKKKGKKKVRHSLVCDSWRRMEVWTDEVWEGNKKVWRV